MDPVEPSAAIRAAAHAVRELYVTLKNEGFSEVEALSIVSTILQAQIKGNS